MPWPGFKERIYLTTSYLRSTTRQERTIYRGNQGCSVKRSGCLLATNSLPRKLGGVSAQA